MRVVEVLGEGGEGLDSWVYVAGWFRHVGGGVEGGGRKDVVHRHSVCLLLVHLASNSDRSEWITTTKAVS